MRTRSRRRRAIRALHASEMDRASRKRLMRLQKQEARTAAKYEKAKPSVFAAVQDKIPDGLRDKLELAFRKGFQLVFEKGEGLIGKTYDAEGLQREYQEREQAMDGRATGRRLRRLGARSRAAVRGGTGIALAEGAALGLLGVGLPDIPLFLAGLLRGLYRIALSFGFDFRTDGERCYLLLLIAASLSRGEERERLGALADEAAQALDCGGVCPATLEECIHAAAGRLAEEMLAAKFVQGLPVVGIAGGLQNVPVYRRVTGFAARAYEKRSILRRG